MVSPSKIKLSVKYKVQIVKYILYLQQTNSYNFNQNSQQKTKYTFYFINYNLQNNISPSNKLLLYMDSFMSSDFYFFNFRHCAYIKKLLPSDSC